MKALIIDDKRTISESLKSLIASSGYFANVSMASNGLDACKMIRDDNYDLIVIDLNLPEMGGQEVLQYIEQLYGVHSMEGKRKDNYPHIMLISGDIDVEKIHDASKLNVEEVLTKPFNVQDFNHKLYSILENLNGEIIAA
ncbi:response regulator [Halobacteriovorax sp. GFR7]|uniref:response regulator n=1 Tax=unclassified Halobacteriovorax TaxID=2639665 RepID=UPI00371E7C80